MINSAFWKQISLKVSDNQIPIFYFTCFSNVSLRYKNLTNILTKAFVNFDSEF